MERNSHNDVLNAGTPGEGMFDPRHITQQQLAELGVSQIAYVRPVIVNGQHGYAIHAADGTAMAVAGDRDIAVAAIVQQEMFPLSVH